MTYPRRTKAHFATALGGLIAGLIFAMMPVGLLAQTAGGVKERRIEKPAASQCSKDRQEKNSPPALTEVTVDEQILYLPIRPGYVAEHPASADMLVGVRAIAKDPDHDEIRFEYAVSGGRIIGRGPEVVWDLTDSNPGTYTIVTSASDGCGAKSPPIKTSIAVVDSVPSCVFCECPTLTISGPATLVGTKEAVFTADVAGGSQAAVTYTWTVTNAEIISGQGTPKLTVRMPSDKATGTTSVDVLIGALPQNCSCPDRATRLYENGVLKN